MVSSARLSAGTLALLVVWVGVYWSWTPREPGITLAPGEPDEPVNLAADEALSAPILITTPPARAETSSVEAAPPKRPPRRAAEPAPPAPLVTIQQGSPKPTDRWPKVIPPEMVAYTVKDGDTLESISRKFYGTTVHARAIAEANATSDPMRLREGRILNVPKDPKNVQGKPAPEPPKTLAPPATPDAPSSPSASPAAAKPPSEYIVQDGDSLSRIAKKLYGDANLSNLLFEANRDQLASPDEVRAGQKLKVPAK